MPASAEERVYTTLALLSVAVRPLADGTSPDLVRLDRTALWRLAEETGARSNIGRTTFYSLAGELADDVPDAVEVLPRGGNRKAVSVFRVDADPFTWADEVLEPLGFADLDSALAAASALGIDVTSPLPADTLLAAVDDAAEELIEKACTRCLTIKPADDFADRNTGTLQSWCRTCSAQAVRDYRARNRPAGAPTLPAPAARTTSADTLLSGDKVCPGCRTRKPLAHFHRDASRGDDHAVRCKSCRADAAHDAALRRYSDL